MAKETEIIEEPVASWEAESLFARDVTGELIRLTRPDELAYQKLIKVTVDGREITIPAAAPLLDSVGNVKRDDNGATIPRNTTILDAVKQAYANEEVDFSTVVPTLCHSDHLSPVGVCRVCSVVITQQGGRGGEETVASCVYPIKPGMSIHTQRSPEEKRSQKVRNSVEVIVQLLANQHLPHSDVETSDLARLNQIVRSRQSHVELTPILEPTKERAKPVRPHQDHSSPFILVDHTACILCERCIRSCNDIKGNFVIGRTEKGAAAGIGFDLNDPMGESSCVECGECMLSCPTTALTYKEPRCQSEWTSAELEAGATLVELEELYAHPILGKLARRFLEWNRSSVVRRTVKAGQDVCKLGDSGATAFIIESGEYGLHFRDPRVESRNKPSQFWKRIGALFSSQKSPLGPPDLVMTREDLIFGEMTCLNQYPRSATVRAQTDGVLLEVRRNILYALLRNPGAREVLDRIYVERAINNHLQRGAFFADLDEEERRQCYEFLVANWKVAPDQTSKVELVRFDPEQVIFEENEPSSSFYLIRIGHVRFYNTMKDGEIRVVNYLGPNTSFGEVGLISSWDDVRPLLPPGLQRRRTASASALDDVELVRIEAGLFYEMLKRFPKLREKTIAAAKAAVKSLDSAQDVRNSSLLRDFTDQGLFHAQKLLVLDLDSCTRCDECSRACADTHGGVSRLVREGSRFDHWLVASACRSCMNPYCLVGCPVDAIHRDGERLEIRIESHCIGCGLCATNCPYGNINMVEEKEGKEIVSRATTCDLCAQVTSPGQEVSCVFACPHNAAFRMSGKELLQLVERGNTQ